MQDKHTEELEEIYKRSLESLKKNKGKITCVSLSKEEQDVLDVIIGHCEWRKAVLTVLITSLCHKIVNLAQDVRLHQSNMNGGYSGRTLDTKIITPFMKRKGFPAMMESGWLTRSLEQNSPYDLNYRGKMTPPALKKAFLCLLNSIEAEKRSPRPYLFYLMQSLILLRERNKVKIVKLKGKSKHSIQQIVGLIEEHFEKSSIVGTARLPVLAIYSVYECMMKELKRFRGKKLLPLSSHTSADCRSGDIGDIEVASKNGVPFEGVEVKYGKRITAEMIEDAFNKIKKHPVKRYYLLSTAQMDNGEKPKIAETIDQVARKHGCQIIVNGILNSLKYYLRLLENADHFIEKYGANLEKDLAIKAGQKRLWNEIIKRA